MLLGALEKRAIRGFRKPRCNRPRNSLIFRPILTAFPGFRKQLLLGDPLTHS